MSDLDDGESCEMKGSGVKPYVLKNVGGVYSCSCPAWRNQSVAIESRTCKHLRKLRGDEAEKARVGSALPAKAKPSAAKKDAPPLLLAHPWDSAQDLAGWWMSEKLDGVRAYWDGKRFLSRLGNEYHAPDWFTEGLPAVPLDGEIWMARGAFQRTVSVVRRQDKSEHWKELRFVVFDAPSAGGAFEERMAFVREEGLSKAGEYASALDQMLCRDEAHLRERLAEVEAGGGEGLMMREPGSEYAIGRSTTLLKVKSFHDAEAVVVGHSAGKGKHKGKVGALVLRLPDGTEFNVGTGLSDAERRDPPGIGSNVTFRYQELTDGGVPRFPSFLRVAEGGAVVAAPEGAGVKDVAPKARAKKVKAAKAVPDAKAGTDALIESAADSVADSASDSPPGDTSYFELVDDKSAKFWEITAAGLDVTVRYGRIGTNGQSKTKSFDSPEKARAHREKLTEQKVAKGYGPATPG